ncbi:MAG: hypothetical protein CMM93_04225 [Rickettsiales bacterium]|nr:hypothetical protein [Rickettsiales bacterium]|tara:strand:- start:893 stop:1576 length:684 start_codon:yes stop_codon:yes gene_type:complete
MSKLFQVQESATEITINETNITHIGSSFSKLANTYLELVDLSDNNLVNIDGLAGLNIKTLILDNNNLKDLSVIGKIYGLKALSVQNNNLRNAKGIAHTSIETLNISNNRITDFTPIFSAAKLKSLIMKNAAFTGKKAPKLRLSSPNIVPTIKKLNISNNPVELIHLIFKKKSPVLSEQLLRINAKNCGLTEINFMKLEKYSELKKVNFEDNDFSEVIEAPEWVSISV